MQLSNGSLADLLDALRREARYPSDHARVLHDLQVHQIELEMQNRDRTPPATMPCGAVGAP